MYGIDRKLHATEVCAEGNFPQGRFALYALELEIMATFS